MTTQTKAYIAASGMITAIGCDSKMTAASIRAGIVNINEVEYYDDDFNPVNMFTVPGAALEFSLNDDVINSLLTARQYRMLQLSTLAISKLKDIIPGEISVPLFLAGPENLSDEGLNINRSFVENLSIQSGINLDLESSRWITTGRAGGLDVIDVAFKYFRQSGAEFAIVGGVDTFFDKRTIDYYLAQERLLTTESMDGFIPGEAAAFLLLVSDKAPVSLIDTCKIFVTEPGHGFEEGHLGSVKPYLGSGLADAVNMALAGRECSPVKVIFSSMNGESHFSKELGVAISRNSDHMDDNYFIEHISEYCGDVGAAIGPVMLGVLHENFDAKLDPALVYCSSDNGFRSAILVSSNL